MAKLKCKNCGNTSFGAPLKTWQMCSPLPDSEGNITITIMGSFECPNCGKKVRGAIKKIKTNQSVEGSYSKREELLKRLESEEKIDLQELSSTLNIKINTLRKVIEVYIKKGKIRGQLTNDFFVHE